LFAFASLLIVLSAFALIVFAMFGVLPLWGWFLLLHVLFGPPAAVALGVLVYGGVGLDPVMPGQDGASLTVSYLANVLIGLFPGYLFGWFQASFMPLSC
jgi:hypothetical protein